MLDANLKSQLHTHFAAIVDPVELVVTLDESPKSQELNSLVNDLASLSDKLTVVADSSYARAPSLLLRSTVRNTRIRFSGVPMGHEFTSLILAILHSGGHATKASNDELEQINALNAPLKFEVFISLSCQTCPAVVQALNTLAAINPMVEVDMIDGALFQQEVAERNVMAVPSVFLNGQPFSQGAISLSNILLKLDSKAAEKQAAALNDKAPFDVLVVGAGPAGSAAAIYAARKGLRTGLVAERFGGQVADTVGIENFISVKATEGPKLVAQLEEHVRDYDVDIMPNQRAKALRSDKGYALELDNGAVLNAKTVLIATGARWREMNVPGEKEYRGKGVAYCPHCDGPLFKNKHVAVIGGGNSGIEAALDLANIVAKVTVLEFDSKLRADEVLQRKARNHPKITIITQAQTTEVVGNGQKVTALNYTKRDSGEQVNLALDGIFVQIGLVPNSEWLRGSLELSPRGEVLVDERGATSLPGVFAAGDVTTSPYKQIIIAMGSGANACLGAFDYLLRHQDDSNEAAA